MQTLQNNCIVRTTNVIQCYFNKYLGLCICTCLFMAAADLQAQQASYNNGVVTLPTVSVFDQYFSVDLNYIVPAVSTDPSLFVLTRADATNGIIDSQTSIFDGEAVTIPTLDLNGDDLWAILTLVNVEPITFQLANAGINDSDDDDDTIDDIDDVYPYVVNDLTDPQSLNGNWLLFFKVESASGACANEVGEYTKEGAFISYNGQTQRYHFEGVVSGDITVSNKMFSLSGFFPDDGGTTNRQLMTLTVHPATPSSQYMTMTGTEDWTWTNGEVNCPVNNSKIWATRNLSQESPPEGF